MKKKPIFHHSLLVLRNRINSIKALYLAMFLYLVTIHSLQGQNCDTPAWNPATVYAEAGQVVSHQDKDWENKWWTQGEEPGTTGEFGVWLDLGPCAVGGNQVPQLNMVSPLGTVNQEMLGEITLVASATDVDGSIVSVVFSLDNQVLNGTNDSGNNYSETWTPSAFGTYALEIVATDNESATTTVNTTLNVQQIDPNSGDFIITEAEYEQLFPWRYGVNQSTGEIDPANDFFAYADFVESVNRMSNIRAIFERRRNTTAYRVTRIDLTTNQQTVIRDDPEFNSSSQPIITKVVDYGNIFNEGDYATRRREATAFLANISQETTGGWPTAPGGHYAWGLHFREEVGYENCSTCLGYRDEGNINYPPATGKSYHGRGPIQLSWNYNYGQVSEFLYGDKNVLLNEPELILSDGALAFQTAIWFWMTPQNPKPSAHDVMVGNWTPSCFDEDRNRTAGLGMTVNIINGGLECGSGTENPKVVHRIGHYQRHAGILGTSLDVDGGNTCDACGCANQQSFGGFEGEPDDCPGVLAIDVEEETTEEEVISELPALILSPNPTDGLLKLSIEVAAWDEVVDLSIFNVQGQKVLNILESEVDKGRQDIIIDVQDLANGVYVLVYKTRRTVRSMRLVKRGK